MHDWDRYVRERLPPLELGPEREASIIGEVAQQLEQAYSEAVADGAPDAEAVRRAESHFPDWQALAREIRQSEHYRTPDRPDQRKWLPLSSLKKDVLYALRLLKANPGFTAIAVFTLAFGIGANTAIFTLVDALALWPLPYGHPEQLTAVETRKTREPELESWTSAPDYFDIRERTRFFSSIAAISPVWNMVLTGLGAADLTEGTYV